MSHKDPWAMCYRDSSIAVANGARTVPTTMGVFFIGPTWQFWMVGWLGISQHWEVFFRREEWVFWS